MYNEVKYYLDNKSFEGIELSRSFLISLMKWAHIPTLKYDSEEIKGNLEVFKVFFNNRNLIDYPSNIREEFYKRMECEFGYSAGKTVEMISTFDKYFMDYEDVKNTKIIAVEGIDGSGKTEQANLLKNLLEKQNYKVLVLSFPVYESFFGKEIGHLLSGKGKVDANSVDSRSMSLWYALDRYSAIKKINLNSFDYVIFNRYTLSSAVYQSVRNNDDKIIDWIFNLENSELNLPIPDLYLVLDVNVNQSHSNISKKGERVYLESEKDVYEKSDFLLENARNKYIDISKEYINVDVVNCNNVSGELKSIAAIHEIIKEKLEKWNLLNITQ